MSDRHRSAADDHRSRAMIIRAFAEETVDPDMRNELLDLAETCDRLNRQSNQGDQPVFSNRGFF